MTRISKNISEAVTILKSNDVVAIPTETVYGLAGNIYSQKAIKKIFEVKQRPFFNPLIVHVHSMAQVDELVSEFPPEAKKLATTFWPGSLTLILPKKDTVPDIITAGKNSVAIRMPNHPTTLSLLKALNTPLAAPSANPFNRISPTTAQHVKEYFNNCIPLVLDGGPCKNGIESTIIGFENNTAVVYRFGAISIEDIEAVIGKVQIKTTSKTTPNAPGMLAKHYAPKTKTYLSNNLEDFIQSHPNKRIGVICFKNPLSNQHVAHTEVLSATGNLKEAAAKLYQTLHKLDTLNLDIIVAERLPDVGLGKSVNDRLERATK
ncbi:L-threonylcarbamoyladenylate synthase [Bizionia sediminis]|uniref:Threonylcarbamoyl-AMP synthase n=1 Tax=Bizionia sediminis TaxID=1737064 RepID=A0ABW5KTZ8_9FLAO